MTPGGAPRTAQSESPEGGGGILPGSHELLTRRKGLSVAMPVAEEIRDHQARCLSYLISLQMLAQGEAGVPLPRWAAAEVAQATGAILAEAEAASRDALAAGSGRQNPVDETFLRVRLDRLATVADLAIAAARDGHFAVMGRHLRRFDVLTTAIWTVQQAVYDQAPPSTHGTTRKTG